jgi:hypothetical protein
MGGRLGEDGCRLSWPACIIGNDLKNIIENFSFRILIDLFTLAPMLSIFTNVNL